MQESYTHTPRSINDQRNTSKPNKLRRQTTATTATHSTNTTRTTSQDHNQTNPSPQLTARTPTAKPPTSTTQIATPRHPNATANTNTRIAQPETTIHLTAPTTLTTHGRTIQQSNHNPTRTDQKDHPRAKDQPENPAAPRSRHHTKQHTQNSNDDQHKPIRYNQLTRTLQPASHTKETHTTTEDTTTQKQYTTSRKTDHVSTHNQSQKRPQETDLTPNSTKLTQPTETNKQANNDAAATQTEPTKSQQTPTRPKTSARPINQNKYTHKHIQTTSSFQAEHAPAKTTTKPEREAHPTTRTTNSVHPQQNQSQPANQNTPQNPVKNNTPATSLRPETIPEKQKFDLIIDSARPHHDHVERNQPTGEANTHKQHPTPHKIQHQPNTRLETTRTNPTSETYQLNLTLTTQTETSTQTSTQTSTHRFLKPKGGTQEPTRRTGIPKS